MTQHEEENLEDYLERFLYNLQKSKQSSLNSDTIRTIFLKGVRDDYINVLNLMGAGDISFLPFNQICELCRKYSRGKTKTGKYSGYIRPFSYLIDLIIINFFAVYIAHFPVDQILFLFVFLAFCSCLVINNLSSLCFGCVFCV